MSELTEHQKLQEARRKDYEIIKDDYAHLKQVIINDETLEQTKAALEEFKTNEELKAAALRFNPALPRWLNVARDRIIRWERDHPKPEPPKPESKPKKKPKKESEKEPETKPEVDKEPEKTSESESEESELDSISPDADLDTHSDDADNEETEHTAVEPETEEEKPHEAE